jgi:NADH dehydrogenase/NADH:ubiquinone oxidoreductase subunit G
MVRLTINGESLQVPEGWTLLEACRENGIHVPTLCHHPALEPYGACRLCVVELVPAQGRPRLVASCVYPCEEGAVVQTDSEAATKSRRLTGELLLAGAYESPQMLALAQELGVGEVRFRLPEAHTCVLCGLCVRACREIVGISAISVIQRGMAKKVATPFQVASSRCIGCGTCVLICPTGAFEFSGTTGYKYVPPSASAYRLGYYRASGELDLAPTFVKDLRTLLEAPKDEG